MKKRYDKPLSAGDLAALPDKAIDTSDIPPLGEAFWRNARVAMPGQGKRQLTLRLDAEVLDWFKARGKGYQTRINAVLKAYVEAQRER